MTQSFQQKEKGTKNVAHQFVQAHAIVQFTIFRSGSRRRCLAKVGGDERAIIRGGLFAHELAKRLRDLIDRVLRAGHGL